ncbi:MAG: D-2-hydroxyacid dehydrogenase [Planctomycetes bacterium]|nr:D-2-hydroxyacid dehydrogenase [Planctomycetota bacterium]
MKIVVLDGYTLNPGDNLWTEVEKLGQLTVYDRTSDSQIIQRAGDAEIVVVNKAKLPASVLQKLPKLKFVAVLATGYNVVDVAASRKLNVPVSNVPIYGTDSVAQFTFALLLEMCHNVGLHSRLVHEGQWAAQSDFCFWKTPLVELAGLKMGIVGFGRIGRRVGELAHAFGMDVLAYDAIGGKEPPYKPFAFRTLEQLFAEADAISMHCPQTADNAGMVNKKLLGLMKPAAYFINTARGGLVNEADLAAALNAGKLAGAAVDVVSEEPIKAANPLLSAKNCIITPHIAWATLAARRRLMRVTAENIAAFLKGSPINVVN